MQNDHNRYCKLFQFNKAVFLNYCVKLNESDLFFLFAQSLFFLNENPFVPTKIKHVLNDYFSQMSLVKKI